MMIQELPLDIRRYILTFHGHSISKTLQDDIIEYMATLDKIVSWYQMTHEDFFDDFCAYDLVQNDLFRYMNENVPTLCGYMPKFYNIWKRKYGLQTNRQVDGFIEKMERWEVKRQVHCMFGILNTMERMQFIQFMHEWYRE